MIHNLCLDLKPKKSRDSLNACIYSIINYYSQNKSITEFEIDKYFALHHKNDLNEIIKLLKTYNLQSYTEQSEYNSVVKQIRHRGVVLTEQNLAGFKHYVVVCGITPQHEYWLIDPNFRTKQITPVSFYQLVSTKSVLISPK